MTVREYLETYVAPDIIIQIWDLSKKEALFVGKAYFLLMGNSRLKNEQIEQMYPDSLNEIDEEVYKDNTCLVLEIRTGD